MEHQERVDWMEHQVAQEPQALKANEDHLVVDLLELKEIVVSMVHQDKKENQEKTEPTAYQDLLEHLDGMEPLE